MTTRIGHFSHVQFNYVRGFTTRIVHRNSDIEVGDTLSADVTFGPRTDPLRVWVLLPQDGSALDGPSSARLVTLSAPGKPFAFDKAEISWDGSDTGHWNPEITNLTLAETSSGWEAEASSTCTSVDFSNTFLNVIVTARVTLMSVSDPEDTALLSFPLLGSVGDDLAPASPYYDEMIPVLDMDAGDEFNARFNTWWTELKTCLSEGYYATTTDGAGGETPPPMDDDPETLIPGGVGNSVDDPEGDYTSAGDLEGRGFTAEQQPPDGIDITHVQVVHEPGGTRTIVTVTFKGSFREVEGQSDRSVSIRANFYTEGSYLFEAQYLEGSAFVSGGPQGSTVATEWLADNKFRFVLDGYAPAPGDQVRIEVLSRKKVGEVSEASEDQARVDITA
jgi:hypothetical protein